MLRRAEGRATRPGWAGLLTAGPLLVIRASEGIAVALLHDASQLLHAVHHLPLHPCGHRQGLAWKQAPTCLTPSSTCPLLREPSTQTLQGFKHKQVPLASVLLALPCHTACGNPGCHSSQPKWQLLPHHSLPAPSRDPQQSPKKRQKTSPITLHHLGGMKLSECLSWLADVHWTQLLPWHHAWTVLLSKTSQKLLQAPQDAWPVAQQSGTRGSKCPTSRGSTGSWSSAHTGHLPMCCPQNPGNNAPQRSPEPFHTPWASLKLFCLHHPGAEDHQW